jgi:hypothetical protein
MAEFVDAAASGDGLGELFVVGDLDPLVDRFRGQDDAGARPSRPRRRGQSADDSCRCRVTDQAEWFAVRTPAQLVRVWSMAGLTLGLASKSNSWSHFSRGKPAARMRRSERRRSRSSHSARRGTRGRSAAGAGRRLRLRRTVRAGWAAAARGRRSRWRRRRPLEAGGGTPRPPGQPGCRRGPGWLPLGRCPRSNAGLVHTVGRR